jgi:hypothetical protein
MLAILFLVMAEVWNVPDAESKSMRAVARKPGRGEKIMFLFEKECTLNTSEIVRALKWGTVLISH